MTRREMLSRLTSEEYAEWMALYQIDPWGDQRADMRNAILCGNVIAPHLEKGKSPEIKNYMPFTDFDEPEENTNSLTGKAGSLVASRIFGRG